jgi:hypothetical protein
LLLAARVDFSKTTGFNSSSTFVLAEASVRNPIVRGKDIRLTDPASALLRALNIDGFKTAFGDSFVRGIKSGGEFFAVFRLTSLRQETQQQLASTLTAEINGFVSAGAFSLAFNTAKQSENDRAEVERANFTPSEGHQSTKRRRLWRSAAFTEFLTRGFKNMADFSLDGSIHYICIDWRHLE